MAYTMAYLLSVNERGPIMTSTRTTRRLATALALLLTAALAPFALATPAHAEEPVPVPKTPLEQCESDRIALTSDVAYWKGQASVYEELYDSYRASNDRLYDIAAQWQLKAVDQTETIARQRQHIDRLSDRRDALRAKVAELRKRLEARG